MGEDRVSQQGCEVSQPESANRKARVSQPGRESDNQVTSQPTGHVSDNPVASQPASLHAGHEKCGSPDRATTPFAVACGQKTISFKKVGWHATWHGHLHKEDTPLNKWLKMQALEKIERVSSCEVAPV